MSLRRALPLPFLLPAWGIGSLRQEAQFLSLASRRGYSSKSNSKTHKKPGDDDNGRVSREKTGDQKETAESKDDVKNSISLFEELFPDDALPSTKTKSNTQANLVVENEIRAQRFYEDTFDAWDPDGKYDRVAPKELGKRPKKPYDTKKDRVDGVGSSSKTLGKTFKKIEDTQSESWSSKPGQGDRTGIRKRFIGKEETRREQETTRYREGDRGTPVSFSGARYTLGLEDAKRERTPLPTPSLAVKPKWNGPRPGGRWPPPKQSNGPNRAVLALGSASKTLSESDFFRLSPKGAHIEGWASGIEKVLVARNPLTLAHKGMYYIVFNREFAALTYERQVLHAHETALLYTPESLLSTTPPHRGVRKDWADIDELMKIFTLIPAAKQNANIEYLQGAKAAAVQPLIDEGAFVARVQRASEDDMGSSPYGAMTSGEEDTTVSTMRIEGGHQVLLVVDDPKINILDVEAAVDHDGESRNLPWNLAAKDAVVRLQVSNRSLRRQQRAGRRSEKQGLALEEEGVYEDDKEKKRKPFQHSATRYIVSFAEKHEAQRFVRSWHMRPFPIMYEGAGQSPPLVQAEVLW